MAINLPYPNPDPSTGEWDVFALKQNMLFLARAITSLQAGQLVPTGGILFMRSGSTCPTGYTKITTYTGRFIKLDTTAGGTGASTVTGTLGAPSSTTAITAGAVAVASSTHVHSVAGLSAAPAYVALIMCEKA
jgi:hypothetical protein